MKEDNETIADCARREVLDETGLQIEVHEYGELQECVVGVSDHYPREQHVTLWVLGHYQDGEPEVKEPHKHDSWEWHEPGWVFRNVPQEGEQIYWTPLEIWRDILCGKLEFPAF
jgi:ADP-ribose pyrophosphatase YjhB (NUDIX family)